MHCAMNQKPFLDTIARVDTYNAQHSRAPPRVPTSEHERANAIVDIKFLSSTIAGPLSRRIYGVRMHVNHF